MYECQLADSFSDSYSICKPIKVFQRMCKNLIEIGRQDEVSAEGLLCLRNALELLTFISPNEIECKLLLSRVYLHLDINLNEVNELLQDIKRMDPASTGIVMFLDQSLRSQISGKKTKQKRKAQVKPRDQDNAIVKFAVGRLMRHRK